MMMADRLTDLTAQITGKTKQAVEALIGKPAVVGYWKTQLPPAGATQAQVTAFNATSLDEIWVYTSGRVHFAINGKAVAVDDKVDRDLPPEEPTLMA